MMRKALLMRAVGYADNGLPFLEPIRDTNLIALTGRDARLKKGKKKPVYDVDISLVELCLRTRPATISVQFMGIPLLSD